MLSVQRDDAATAYRNDKSSRVGGTRDENAAILSPH